MIEEQNTSTNLHKYTIIFILACFFLLSFASLRHLSLTSDEANHYRYGQQMLAGNSTRFDDSKMPVSSLNALPAKAAGLLPDVKLRSHLSGIAAARTITIIFSAFVALMLYKWSRDLYGAVPAVLALFLYAFNPTIIAHSQLVTTDIYATGMTLLTIYSLWRFNKSRNWKSLCLFAFIIGLAQITKYTAVLLYPLCGLLMLAQEIPFILSMTRNSEYRRLAVYMCRAALIAGFVVFVSVVIINIGFLFNRTATPLGEYKFRSRLFQIGQASLSSISSLPIPLPYPYLEGLDWVHERERTGKGYGAIYLLGHLRRGHGIPGYYFVAYLFKEPIAGQIIFLIALITYLYRKKYQTFLNNELFLLGPIVFFTLFFNFIDKAQIGIRFFLVAFPFIYIFSSRLLLDWQNAGMKKRVAIYAMAVYMAVSVLSYYPHFIPYFNELVPDRRFAYKILADSNLDWGQGSWYLQQYLEKHPDVKVDPCGPTTGTIAIRANKLVGVSSMPDTYRWLRDNFEPSATIAYYYLIYHVSEDDLSRIGVRRVETK